MVIVGINWVIRSTIIGSKSDTNWTKTGKIAFKVSTRTGARASNILWIAGKLSRIIWSNCEIIGNALEINCLYIPLKEVFTLSIISPKSAPAVTASLERTPPKSSHSCFQASIPALPSASIGAKSAYDLPNISFARAFLVVASSISANLAITKLNASPELPILFISIPSRW